MLHITNGDATVELLKAASIDGEYLPWRDVLHEGPVPAGLALRDLSRTRAEFIASMGWGAPAAVRESFERRDTHLRRYGEYAEVVLWFEHDLYDQLQIIQILDWFAGIAPSAALSLICIGAHPSVDPFYGLGQLAPEHMPALLEARKPVAAAQLDVAQRAWRAFCSPDPRAIEELCDGDTSALEFLAPAFVRLMEEYPDSQTGLGRTERQALSQLTGGANTAGKMFGDCQLLEKRPYMGDSTFYTYLNTLAAGPRPLLTLSDANGSINAKTTAAITEDGRSVVNGALNAVELNGIDRWLGGVHLAGNAAEWVWDAQAQRLRHNDAKG